MITIPALNFVYPIFGMISFQFCCLGIFASRLPLTQCEAHYSADLWARHECKQSRKRFLIDKQERIISGAIRASDLTISVLRLPCELSFADDADIILKIFGSVAKNAVDGNCKMITINANRARRMCLLAAELFLSRSV